MELLQLALILFAGVMVSSLLEPLLPRVSLPLVQICIGILMALFVKLPLDVSLDSELFLVLFIAPLLFDESRNADNRALWNNKGSILSLAIGLVVVTVLTVGFTLHILVPSIPLAAAFTLGAALGPTDAVAVASLGKEIQLSERQQAQLSGEALLNDASGVVSFHFALAAATTGAFSLMEATQTFAIQFFGGIALGLVVAIGYLVLARKFRQAGLDNVVVHVLFELCLPFFLYLAAEFIHVSGILAVVAAGLLLTFSPLRLLNRQPMPVSPQNTKLELVSNSVWEVFAFVLNGVIFITMGIVLPDLTEPVLTGLDVTSWHALWLLLIVLAATAVMHGTRFLWILVANFISANEETGGRLRFAKGNVRDALITTLAGAKGAVALAIAFTIPYYLANGDLFPSRNLLLFIACGVCVVSLLLANFVVPLLAPKPDDDAPSVAPEVQIALLSSVIDELWDRKNSKNAQAIATVVRSYQQRIALIRRENVSPRHLRKLRLEILDKQDVYIRDAMADETVDRRVAEDYLKRVERLRLRLKRAARHDLVDSTAIKPLASSTNTFKRVAKNIGTEHQVRSTIEFKIEVEKVAVSFLEGASRSKDPQRAEAAKALLAEHKPLLSALKQRKKLLDSSEGIIMSNETGKEATIKRTKGGKLKRVRPSAQFDTLLTDVHAEALRLELEQIQDMRRKGKISNAAARDLRQDVYIVQMGLSDL